jgi:hypothetical protein
MNDDKQRFTTHFIIAAGLLMCAYIIMYRALAQGILSHCDYDSYTRQAAAWWQGKIYLPENISWLELAWYDGHYYVSFPPFPSVIQFLLVPFFGMNTPDNLINTLFGFASFVLVYRYMMRRGFGGLISSLVALLLTLGSNLFYMSLTGWVWFSAQTQGFFFMVLAVTLIDSEKKTAWTFSFLSLGVAFACRPMNIVYAPLLFYLLYNKIKDNGKIRTCVRAIKYVLPLAAVGVLAAVYNIVRFDNPFEFGHNYLPEFINTPQFSLDYVPGNFLEILKLPGGVRFWPEFNGTLFFLVNPAFILLAVRLFERRLDTKRIIYLSCLAVHLILILSHKTMGGWQFGSRYLVDMLPFSLLIIGEHPQGITLRRHATLPAVLAAIGIAVNVWGAVWYYSYF